MADGVNHLGECGNAGFSLQLARGRSEVRAMLSWRAAGRLVDHAAQIDGLTQLRIRLAAHPTQFAPGSTAVQTPVQFQVGTCYRRTLVHRVVVGSHCRVD